MADFSSLKQTIQSYIKQNGNEEITGNILQDVLLAMVSTMGDSAINGLVSSLQDEVTARQNADGTLQDNITAEATARGNADTALGGRIDGLQTAINGINTKLAEGYIYAGIATPSTNPGTPSGKVFYIAVSSGTYTNFNSLTVAQGINILKYNGSAWSKDVVYAIDARPKKNSQNLVTSGGVFDNMGALDVSKLNATENPHTLAIYADLSAALAAIPTDYQKGGMSVKFVHSSDNKYVQYRLTKDEWSVLVTDWKKADDYVEEIEHPITEENVVGYLTDKNKSVLAKLFVDGSLEWLVKNERDKNIDEVIERVDTINLEIPDSETDNVHYLTDKNGVVIATINNVGNAEFKGGGGFDGEITTSKNISFDAIKVITDRKGSVIGWINSNGQVHVEELEVSKLQVNGGSDIGVPDEFITFLSLIANGVENHKFVNERTISILKNQKNNYTRKGVGIEAYPIISLQDDDAYDLELPQSYVSGATSETVPSQSNQNKGGFASLFFPVLKSLNLKHNSEILGKLSCGVASEGQRIGLTPLYGMVDTFDGHLNTCGDMIKSLVEKEDWECICHSMTARYVSNSYLVNGLDSEFANSLLVDATYSGTNGLDWSTTTCYDTVTKKNYKVKQDKSGWDECPVHYAKPFLALTKASDSPLVINPSYSVEYQVKTWLDRCDVAEMPHTRCATGWGSSHSSWHILEDEKYIDTIFARSSNHSNKPPMLVCPTRNAFVLTPSKNNITEHENNYNVYNKFDYLRYKDMIDECVENKSWRIFRTHIYEAIYRNFYVSYWLDYGEQHVNLYGAEQAECGPLCYYDASYPEEWKQPLRYAELMDMIGANEHDYWNNPPSRLNIDSWSDWYPCPGTTMAMFYDLMEYAISKGVTFMRNQDVLDLFGNILAIGCETSSSFPIDNRLAERDNIRFFCKIGADNSLFFKHN